MKAEQTRSAVQRRSSLWLTQKLKMGVLCVCECCVFYDAPHWTKGSLHKTSAVEVFPSMESP